MKVFPRIGVMVPENIGPLRQVLDGVARYASQRRWQVLRHSMARHYIHQFVTAGVQGAIAHVSDQKWTEAWLATGLPVVNTSHQSATPAFPSVLNDEAAIGRLAAEYLLGRGFRHFATLGIDAFAYSAGRFEGFARRLEEAGRASEHHLAMDRVDPVTGWAATPGAFDKVLTEWVGRLPRATAVLAANDGLASQVITRCFALGRAVPEDLAVMGVDDDELTCGFAFVPLTSVRTDAHRIGWLAAEMLDRILAEPGCVEPGRIVTVPPLGITERQSTDIISVEDPDLATALRLIRLRACEPIRVEDVLREVPISRRSLETRFRRALGRSPHEEIRRVQLDTVRHLLRTSDLPMPAIATRVGFRDANFLSRVFRQATGITMSAYRRQHRREQTL